MAKIIFLCVFLVNIVFFFWQYRKGTPEIYLPPNYEDSIGKASGFQKILLLSELPELGLKKEARIHQAEALPSPEAEHETLLVEPQRPLNNDEITKTPDSKVFSDNDFIGPLVKTGYGNTKERSLGTQFMGPLAEQFEIENVIESTPSEQVTIEPTPVAQDSELENLVKEKSDDDNTILEISKNPVLACYQLKEGEYTQDMFVQEDEKNAFKLSFFNQNKRYISSYLVLTQVSESYQEAKSKEQELKQQGIENVWLFRRGLFKKRISLGLFSSEEHANEAKELLLKQIDQVLEVVPSYQTSVITSVKISTQDKQQITAFEQKFSKLIAQKIECRKDSSTSFQTEGNRS